ncbi:MAG: hypothetical protein ACXAC5_08790 [Promethearchaeota archaeon]|jgi:hypothetical protein
MLFQPIGQLFGLVGAIILGLIITGLIFGGIIILKIGLMITKAQSKTDFKWIIGSYLIQYGVILFISTPMLLDMLLNFMTGSSFDYHGPDPGMIAIVVVFSAFISVNLINMIHKPGIKRSVVIALMILGPIIGSNYLLFSTIGNFL